MITVRTKTQRRTAKDEPIFLVFTNDEERITIANQILNMPKKEGKRIWVQYPDGTTATEIEKIAKEEMQSDLTTVF